MPAASGLRETAPAGMGRNSVRLTLPGLALRVEADGPDRLAGTFADVLGAFMAPEGPVELTLHAERDSSYAVSGVPPDCTPAGLGLAEPGLPLEEAVLRAYISRCNRYLLCHAAGLARNDRAIALTAPTTSGKTTLAMGLLAQGWRYLSDEVVPLEPATLRAAPFPRALHIRRASLQVLAAEQLLPALQAAVRLQDLGPDRLLGIPRRPLPGDRRLELAAVVFPAYLPGAVARLGRVPPALAAARLLRQVLNGATLGRDAFLWSLEVVRWVPCYELPVDSLTGAAAALEGLVS